MVENKMERPMKPPLGKYRSKLRSTIKFVKLLRIEPYMFLMVFQMSIKSTPGSQLIEDKICRHWYNQSVKYCEDMPKMKGGHGESDDYKSKILADSAQFSVYHSIVTTLPALVWALFIGSWIDKYIKGRKIMMMLSAITGIVDTAIMVYLSVEFNTSVYYILLSYLPNALLGGHLASHIAMWSYITATTPRKLRSLRFMVMELCMFTASPIGSALGGKILTLESPFNRGEIRNYSSCYLISLFVEIIALIWIYFAVCDKHAKKHQTIIEMKEKKYKEMHESDECKLSDEKCKIPDDKEKVSEKIEEKKHPLRMLFDLNNIKEMYRTCIKPRPNKIRTQIWLLFACGIVMSLVFRGSHQMGYQFVQKIYQWAPDKYAYMNSVNMVVHIIATLTIIPILIKVIKISDIPLAITGYCINFLTYVIRGSILTPLGFYISVPIGSLGGVSSIGTRSHFSKIVSMDEIGKVFSLQSLLDTVVPLISATLFTFLFKYTQNSYPGAIYQIVAAISLIPVSMLMWIDLYTVRPDDMIKKKEKMENDEHINQTPNHIMTTHL